MNAVQEYLQSRLPGHPSDQLNVAVAAAMGGRPILLLGPPGTGKSTLGNCLVRLLRLEPCGRYDAGKEDTVRIHGAIDITALSAGRMEFALHDRSITHMRSALVDDLTQASPAMGDQAMWMEIVNSNSLYGRPLQLELLVLTANPQADGAPYEVLVSLVDRIPVVIHVLAARPTASAIEKAARVNLDLACGTPEEIAVPDASELRSTVRAHRARLGQDARVRSGIAAFCGALVSTVSGPTGNGKTVVVSPRTYAEHLPALFLDLLALASATGEPLTAVNVVELGRQAGRFTVATKCDVPDEAFRKAFDAPATRSALERLSGALPAPADDPLRDLVSGDITYRVAALAALRPADLAPNDRGRIVMLSLAMLRDVLEKSRERRSLLGQFWKATGHLPAVRRSAELAILRSRIQQIVDVEGSASRRDKSADALLRKLRMLRTAASEAESWAPHATSWRR